MGVCLSPTVTKKRLVSDKLWNKLMWTTSERFGQTQTVEPGCLWAWASVFHRKCHLRFSQFARFLSGIGRKGNVFHESLWQPCSPSLLRLYKQILNFLRCIYIFSLRIIPHVRKKTLVLGAELSGLFVVGTNSAMPFLTRYLLWTKIGRYFPDVGSLSAFSVTCCIMPSCRFNRFIDRQGRENMILCSGRNSSHD